MIFAIQNKNDLEKKLAEAGDKLVVIDFFANWCGPCKIISPKLEQLSAQYTDKAVVLKVDVDDCEDIALEYNITSMPTFVFMKHGQVIETFVGGNSEKLTKNMEKFISEGSKIVRKVRDLPDINSCSDEISASSGIEEMPITKTTTACDKIVAKAATEVLDSATDEENAKNE